MATATQTLSVVINTKNTGATLKQCLQSVKRLADEIVVMDMHSTDKTVQIAKQFGARVFTHPDVGLVEPARNAAIKKAKGRWILILDADEELPPSLAQYIRQSLITNAEADAYFLPRKNMIFGKWVKTGWWPDHVLRLFRAGQVTWQDEIHSVPQVTGSSVWVANQERYAIIHHHYDTIDQFIDRAQRYGKVVSEQTSSTPTDPLSTMFDELFRRYYAWEGSLDGQHGYYLSLLQAWTAMLPTLYSWEKNEFSSKKRMTDSLATQLQRAARAATYWEVESAWRSAQGLRKTWLRVRLARLARKAR